jgi:hypothetical protein
MKRILYYSVVSMLLLSAACTKVLDKSPVSSIPEENYYRNTAEVETGVLGAYAALRAVYNYDYVIAGLRSDDSYISDAEGDMNQIDGFGENTSNSYIASYWQNSYYVIKQCNTVLKYLNNVTDATSKANFEGEVKFLRAHMYFNLVRLWGAVPLVTSAVAYNDPALYQKADTAGVYAQIIADLTVAMQQLPGSWDVTEAGRVNSYAAKGMLAKVQLTRKNYAAARVLLQDLVTTPGPCQLLPSFKSVFGTGNEMNAEILYAVRFKSNANGVGNFFTYDLDKLTGAVGFRSASDYRGRYVTADSVRKNTTFLIYASTTGSLSYYDGGKYQDAGSLKYDGGADFVVLRYADILLMYAEVVNEMDGTDAGPAPADALTQFNRIRTRAGVPVYTATSSAVKTRDAFRTAIKAERRLEFGIEDQRWFDLLRWNDAVTVMNAHFVTRGLTATMAAYQVLYAIPQREIDISNGVLKQNTGY